MNEADIFGQHQAFLHRHSTHTVNSIFKHLERVDRRITGRLSELLIDLTPSEKAALLSGKYTTRRLVKLRELIRELAGQTSAITSAGIAEQGKELTKSEIDFTLRAISADLGTAVSASQIYAAAMSRPMLGKHVREWVADIRPALRKQIFAEIREGYTAGEGVSRIVSRIRGTAEQNRKDGLLFKRKRGVEAVVRTSLNHIASVARLESMNAAGVKRYRWLSTLDGRTSKICASRDGKVYDVGKGPIPPAHPNCRSGIVRYTVNPKGNRPFVADDKPVSKIPKNERSDKVGRVRASTTFGQWFKRQDAEFQRNWLLKTKYRLYKDGGYKIDRFIDPHGKEYTIEQLRAKDNATFDRLGL